MAINKNTYNPIAITSIKAVADIPANRFISFGGNISANETKALGVSETKALSGDSFGVISLGTAIIETSVAINIGDNVTSDANGKAKLAAGAMIVNGRALSSTATPGYVTIQLVP